MKCKTFLLVALSLLAGAARAGQIFDDFTSTQIDANVWQSIAPYSDSSVSLGGGLVTFNNHGELLSQGAFTSTLEIIGRFRFTGNIHDVFWVALRTTGTHIDPRFYDNSFVFEIAKQSDDGTRLNVVQVSKYASGIGTIVAATNHNFSFNQFYYFKITDDGTNMNFYFDDLQHPMLSVSDRTTFGHKVGFYNREGTGGGSSISAGSQVEIDFITINSPAPPKINIYTAIELESFLESGVSYQLQSSEDLKTWENLGSPVLGTGSYVTNLYSTRTVPKRYYRFVVIP